MRDASDDFAAAIRSSHRAVTRVEGWRDGVLTVEDIPLEDGDLTIDDNQAIPGTVSLTVPGREWDPVDPLHPLAPFGQQVYVSRGIRYPDGTEELIGLGFYLLEDSDPDTLTGSTRTTARSLELYLEDSRFQRPSQPPAGATFAGEVERIVGSRLPVDDVDPALVNRALPKDLVFEGSRLEALTQIGAAWPARFRVDDNGLLRILPPVADASTWVPVMTLATGSQGVVARWTSPTSRASFHNAVFARGEEDDSAKRAVEGFAYDQAAGSPTEWGGPFGERPLLYASPLLATSTAAQKAAATILARELRRTRVAEVEMIPDPRLEAGDIVELDTPTVAGVGRVAGIRLPLTAAGGSMSLTVEMAP